MKVCIIGAGFIAAAHAAGYQTIPQVELCGIADIREEAARAMAETYHCRVYTDAREMLLAEKPDAVSVCVPTNQHRQAVCLALECGADVLCEKPLALELSESQAMWDTALRCGKRVMAAQVLRFWPEYSLIHDQIASGAVGPVRRIDARRIAHSSRGDWFSDPQKGGGALFDLLVHDLDFVVSILGCHADSLYATGYRNSQGCWIHVNALITWKGGINIHLEAAGDMPQGYPFTMGFRADGEYGCVEFLSQSPENIAKAQQVTSRLFMAKGGEAYMIDQSTFPKNPNAEAFKRQAQAFIAGVEKGDMPIPFDQSIYVMKMVNKILTSLETGCKLL